MRPWSRIAAAVAGLALGGGLAAAPAHAAEPVLKIQAQETYYMYEYGEGPPGDGDLYLLELNLARDPDGEEPLAEDVELTIDASGLEGIATVKGTDGACTHEGFVYTCAYTSIDGKTSVQPFYIRGAEGAKAGASGLIKYTATSANAGTATAQTKAVVGGPELGGRDHAPLTRVAPGSTVSLTPGIANHGRLAAPEGIGVKISGSDGLHVAREHSNCHYRPGTTAAYCTFDTPVAAGAAYEFSSPLKFTVADDLMYGGVSYSAWALGSGDPWEYEDPSDYSETGSGPALTLRPVADSGFQDFGGQVTVTTTQRADYQAIGGAVEGKKGDTVKAELGVKNAGPGSMELGGREGHGAGTYEVTPPEGTHITKIPFPGEDDDWACGAKEKGSRTYVCTLDESFEAGESDTLVFYMHIDKAVKNPEDGRVQALARADYPTRDNKPENDSAAITLNAPGKGSGGGTDGSTKGSDGASGSSAGDSASGSDDADGSMASTGTTALPWIAAASAAALGLGAIAVALTRRRRWVG